MIKCGNSIHFPLEFCCSAACFGCKPISWQQVMTLLKKRRLAALATVAEVWTLSRLIPKWAWQGGLWLPAICLAIRGLQ